MARGKAEATLELIEEMRLILEKIEPASVRAVCYQLFVNGLIPSMAKSVTNGVGVQLRYAREHGIILWEWVVDETREAERWAGWDDKEEFKRSMLNSYRRNRWVTQPIRIEVWSEKGTVRGTVMPVLEEYGIQFRVHHGFSSVTILHDIVVAQQQSKVPLIVLYAGDWDPSGRYMVEVDLPQRLEKLWNENWIARSPAPRSVARYLRPPAFNITIVPVALTARDCQRLPSFPAKRTDTRYKWYIERYGHRAWELDALSPAILRRRVERAILRQGIDWEAWKRVGRCEQAEQASLENVLGEWQRITENISMPAPK
jgi:hypothetical protein